MTPEIAKSLGLARPAGALVADIWPGGAAEQAGLRQGDVVTSVDDLAITDGPGLRWPLQGPMLTFHLAGGEGGMAHMLDHFGPSLKSPWTRLEAPELTPRLRQDVIDGCDDEADGRSIAELVAARDAAIIAVRQAIEGIEQPGRERNT